MRHIFLIALAIAPMSFAVPAPAEDRKLTIFGEDRCPSDTICVVAPESERYRIPKAFRQHEKTPDTQSWAVRSQATLAEGRTGSGSCSPVGGQGWQGCWAEEMRQARAEAKARKNGEEIQ